MKGPSIWFNSSICSRIILALNNVDGTPIGVLNRRVGYIGNPGKRTLRNFVREGLVEQDVRRDFILTPKGYKLKGILLQLKEYEVQ